MTPPPAKVPFFSIVLPCCDVAPYLAECFESVFSQPFPDWEILAVVESSKDRTEEIVRSFADRDPRIRVFTGPRSGSCSVPRNRGVEEARGEYLVFLDGDDTLVPGSLLRVHNRIAARPGADIYPCAMRVRNEIHGRDEPLRDAFPPDFAGELTGPEAIRMAYAKSDRPCPMLQLSVFRRAHLVENNVRCLPGLKRQDSDFFPRSFYPARQVVPLHEPLYIYRIRPRSVSTKADGTGYFHRDYAGILRSLLAFHARVSRTADFDRRLSPLWAKHWLMWIYYYWFSARAIRNTPRPRRRETLLSAFPDGFVDFDCLDRSSTASRRLAGWFMKLYVCHPRLGWLADAFFRFTYFPLSDLRDRLRNLF
jgi:glycosyltransferase involved in cell wall biosynthesis